MKFTYTLSVLPMTGQNMGGESDNVYVAAEVRDLTLILMVVQGTEDRGMPEWKAVCSFTTEAHNAHATTALKVLFAKDFFETPTTEFNLGEAVISKDAPRKQGLVSKQTWNIRYDKVRGIPTPWIYVDGGKWQDNNPPSGGPKTIKKWKSGTPSYTATKDNNGNIMATFQEAGQIQVWNKRGRFSITEHIVSPNSSFMILPRQWVRVLHNPKGWLLEAPLDNRKSR